MSSQKLLLVLSLLFVIFLPGCDAIVGIFKAGFWTAIILVVLIVGLVFYGYKKLQGRNK